MLQIGMSRSSLKRRASARMSSACANRPCSTSWWARLLIGTVTSSSSRSRSPASRAANRSDRASWVAAAQPDQRHADRRGGVQGGIAQLVGDALRVAARLQALRLRHRGPRPGRRGWRARSRARGARPASERIEIAASSCRSAARRSAAYHSKRERARWPSPTATTSPSSTAQLQRLRAGGDRGVEAVGQVELLGQGLEHGGASGGVVLPDVPQRELVERDGLAVRARSARLPPPRRGRTAGCAATSAAADAWWASTLASPPTASSASIIAACRAGSAPAGTAPSTAEARDLVPERHTASAAVEQPGGFERLDGRRAARPGPRAARRSTPSGAHDSSSSARRSARRERRRPGDDRVAHGLRQRGVRLGEDLADEERVARRPGVDVCGVETVLADQLGDGRAAQRGELQPPRVRAW